jgi:hypothetical protein
MPSEIGLRQAGTPHPGGHLETVGQDPLVARALEDHIVIRPGLRAGQGEDASVEVQVRR